MVDSPRRPAIAYLGPETGDAAAAELPAGSALDRIDLLDVLRDGAGPPRSGLISALERIATGEAAVLVVPRLGALAASLRELVALLDWLSTAKAGLVVLDAGLDTDSAAGRRTLALLREIDGWDRAPGPGRAPRGRPGLAVNAPEVGERIARLRAQGLSLRAIADALDADGVPTPRGGERWRASSVQAALGYRRPRPPVQGAPPPRPPHAPGDGPPHGPVGERAVRGPRHAAPPHPRDDAPHPLPPPPAPRHAKPRP